MRWTLVRQVRQWRKLRSITSMACRNTTGHFHGWRSEKSRTFCPRQERRTSMDRARYGHQLTFAVILQRNFADGRVWLFQLAVYNFASRGEWYATQNMCPHKRTIALSRGLIGDKSGRPSVACKYLPLPAVTFRVIKQHVSQSP